MNYKRLPKGEVKKNNDDNEKKEKRINPILQVRGNAGTHDITLGKATLEKCIHLKEGESMKTPSYDKSQYDGKGDRASESTWPIVQGALDVILFEGWMLGFKPLLVDDDVNTTTGINDLELDDNMKEINEYLKQYETWDSLMDQWLIIQVDDISNVYQWRLQAEIAMRERGNPAMTDDQVKDFVERYMPAYHTYLPGLYMNERKFDGKPLLKIHVDESRSPKRIKE